VIFVHEALYLSHDMSLFVKFNDGTHALYETGMATFQDNGFIKIETKARIIMLYPNAIRSFIIVDKRADGDNE
jgi:hypothetical protein